MLLKSSITLSENIYNRGFTQEQSSYDQNSFIVQATVRRWFFDWPLVFLNCNPQLTLCLKMTFLLISFQLPSA